MLGYSGTLPQTFPDSRRDNSFLIQSASELLRRNFCWLLTPTLVWSWLRLSEGKGLSYMANTSMLDWPVTTDQLPIYLVTSDQLPTARKRTYEKPSLMIPFFRYDLRQWGETLVKPFGWNQRGGEKKPNSGKKSKSRRKGDNRKFRGRKEISGKLSKEPDQEQW